MEIFSGQLEIAGFRFSVMEMSTYKLKDRRGSCKFYTCMMQLTVRILLCPPANSKNKDTGGTLILDITAYTVVTIL